MAFLNVFGRAPPPPAPVVQANAEDATAMLDRRVGELEKSIKQADAKIETCKKQAQEKLRAGDRAGAKRALQQCKMEEAKRNQRYAWLHNIEVMSGRMKDVSQMSAQARTMQVAAGTMQAQMKELNPDKLMDMMDELEETMSDINEVQDALSRQLDVPGAMSDMEADAELQKLEAEMAGVGAPAAAMPAAPIPGMSLPASLPAVPTHSLPSALPSLPTGGPAAAQRAPVAMGGGGGGMSMMDELSALES